MKKKQRNEQIIFVVETNSNTKSDDAYFVWLMKMFFYDYWDIRSGNDIFFQIDFVHMNGKTNYDSDRVLKEILEKQRDHTQGKTSVVYCFDIDTTSQKDIGFIACVNEYCKTNKYKLVVSYKEIENVIHLPNNGSKADRVKYFAAHYPKKEVVNIADISVQFDDVCKKDGTTNFYLVIQSIIEFK